MSGAAAAVGGDRGPERARLVRRNTALLTAAQGLAQAAAPVLLIVGSIAIVDLTGRDVSLGVLNGAYFVAAATGAVLLGRMMDRLGRRPGLLLAYALVGLSGLAAALTVRAGSAFGLLAAAVGFGFGFGGVNLARTAVADMYEPERRGRAVGILLAAGTVGAIGSPFLVALLRDQAESRGADPNVVPWLIVPVVAIGALLCAIALRPDPRDLAVVAPGDRPADGPSRAPRQLLSVPAFRMAVIAAAVGQIAMVAVMGVTPVALDHSHHASAAAVSSVISFHIAGMFAFAPLIGFALDRFGHRQGLIAGGITSVVGALLTATDANPLIVGVGLFAIGLGWSATYLGATAVISDLTSPFERGAALGFTDLLVAAGSATAALLSGLVFDSAGFRVLSLAVASLVTVVVIAVTRIRVTAAPVVDPG